MNLLTVFDAVMTELNVTRAAQRLQMTQPAVSNALKRLRHLLNDELFIKVPTGVSPTPKALEIWLPIRDALSQIRQTLQPSTFDPATVTKTFTIAMNDFVTALLLPRLVALLEQSAPHVNLRTVPNTHVNAPVLLEQAEIDLAIGVFPNLNPRLRSYSLLSSPFVCMMRRDHPLVKQPLTLERYIEANHLVVTLSGEPTGLLDPILQEQNLHRRIGLTVNQFAVVPQLVINSDLIAIVPTRLVTICGLADQLHLTPPPIQIAPSLLRMLWHERNHLEASQQWLRSCLIQVCDSLEAPDLSS